METFRKRLNQPKDLPIDFPEHDSFIFRPERLDEFDPATGRGRLSRVRHRRKLRVAWTVVGLG